jgi:hypothetical protein
MSRSDPNQLAFDKTVLIFREICPERLGNLINPSMPKCTDIGRDLRERISRIFAKRLGTGGAQQFAINATGFSADVAFLVALFLFPERFADEEVAAGIQCFGLEMAFHGVEIAKALKYINDYPGPPRKASPGFGDQSSEGKSKIRATVPETIESEVMSYLVLLSGVITGIEGEQRSRTIISGVLPTGNLPRFKQWLHEFSKGEGQLIEEPA